MSKTLLFRVIATLLIAQLLKADEADDAEAALNDLRLATSDALVLAFPEHIKRAIKIDTAALDTKGLSAGAAECVDKAADEAIDLIEKKSIGLASNTLSATFKNQREIVRCGRADTDCLTVLMAKIKSETEGVANLIQKQVEADKEEVDKAIEKITACAQ